MKTRYEALKVQGFNISSFPNIFTYYGDIKYKPEETNNNKERLHYHLSKYATLFKENPSWYNKYTDTYKGATLFLTFKIGTVNNLVNTAIPSELEEAWEFNDRIDKIAELTDSEFVELLNDLSDYAHSTGSMQDDQLPPNLKEIPDSLITRAQKLGWFN